MALFLVVLGGAAVVEVHRAITGGGNKDVKLLKQREESLRRQLMDIQKELEETKSQRDLTEQEAAQLAAINQQLQHDKEELLTESTALKAEKEELSQRAERLLERQQLLEQCAESLKLENSILMEQFDRLKLKHEQESIALQEQLQGLKESVSTSLQQFTVGEITADQLMNTLAELGVELHCPQSQLQELPQRLANANTVQEREQVLEKVELKVDESWFSHMRLVASSPNCAARLMSGAVRTNAQTAAAPAAASVERPLLTPRSLEAAEQNAAAQKLTSHAVLEDAVATDTIPAVHAAPAAIEVAVTEPQVEAKQGTKARSLVFRPMKKAAKMAMGKKQAVVEVDVPFELLSHDTLAPTSNALVPM